MLQLITGIMYIAVKLEGNKYHNIVPLVSGTEKNLVLTTVYDNQTRGTVHIVIKDGDTAVPVESITVAGIPPAEAGKTDINIFCRIQRRNRLYIEISVNDEVRVAKVIGLNRYIPGKSARDKLLLALLLLLIAGITFISLYTNKPAKSAGLVQEVQAIPKQETQKVQAMPKKAAQAGPLLKSHAQTSPAEQTLTKSVAANPDKTKLPAPLLKPQIIYFTPNSSLLNPEAKKKLKALIPLLNSVKELKANIKGHCALFGTEKGRTELSLQRAVNTLNFLKKNGWNPLTEPRVAGYGGKHPVTRNPRKQDLNRRVEIIYPSQHTKD